MLALIWPPSAVMSKMTLAFSMLGQPSLDAPTLPPSNVNFSMLPLALPIL